MKNLENLVEAAKWESLLERREDRRRTVILWVLATLGLVAAVALGVYALYRYFKPDYLDDFEDEFEDEFEEDEDDDFFEDEGDR